MLWDKVDKTQNKPHKKNSLEIKLSIRHSLLMTIAGSFGLSNGSRDLMLSNANIPPYKIAISTPTVIKPIQIGGVKNPIQLIEFANL